MEMHVHQQTVTAAVVLAGMGQLLHVSTSLNLRIEHAVILVPRQASERLQWPEH